MNDIDDFFDQYGRCIPTNNNHPVHQKSRRYFKLLPLEVNYEKIYNKIKKFLDPDTSLSLEAFKEKSEKILEKLKKDKRLSNILNGVGVPFFMPKRKHGDIGDELLRNYLLSLQNSFKDENPNFDFINHCTD